MTDPDGEGGALPPQFAGLRIRAAANADAGRVRALVFGVLREFGLEPDPDSTDADLADIEASYPNRGGVFELIEDGAGELVGTVGLYPAGDGATCELRKMYFAPRVRGRGLGRLVLARTIEQARRLGFRRIVLETAHVLTAANHLYASFGFRPLRVEHLPARADIAYSLDLE